MHLLENRKSEKKKKKKKKNSGTSNSSVFNFYSVKSFPLLAIFSLVEI